jgi:hypothetical protein
MVSTKGTKLAMKAAQRKKAVQRAGKKSSSSATIVGRNKISVRR